jgi:hypothetical protein
MKMIDPNNQSDSFTSRILGFYVTSHIWVRVKIDTQSYDWYKLHVSGPRLIPGIQAECKHQALMDKLMDLQFMITVM